MFSPPDSKLTFVGRQDETLNDLVQEQGGILLPSLRRFYQDVTLATSALNFDWWREFWTFYRRKSASTLTLEDLRTSASPKFMAVSDLLLDSYNVALEAALERGYRVIPPFDEGGGSPILPVLLLVQRHKAISGQRVHVAFASTLAPLVGVRDDFGDLPTQTLTKRDRQRRTDKYSIDSVPFSSTLAPTVGVWDPFGDLPTQSTHQRYNQRSVDSKSKRFRPYSSRLADSVGVWAPLGDVPVQPQYQQAGQFSGDLRQSNLTPFASALAPTVGAGDPFGDVPLQTTNTLAVTRSMATQDVDQTAFTGTLDSLMGLWDDFGDVAMQSGRQRSGQVRSDDKAAKDLHTKTKWVAFTPAGTAKKVSGLWSPMGDLPSQKWMTRKTQSMRDSEIWKKTHSMRRRRSI